MIEMLAVLALVVSAILGAMYKTLSERVAAIEKLNDDRGYLVV